MNGAPNEIIDTSDIAMSGLNGHEEPTGEEADMVATHAPTEAGLSFHVAMRGHTMRDMETLIVEAAALQIVGRYGNDRLAKQIEARCIEMVDAKARAALEAVTTDIIDQPLTPAFGDKKPVTMREYIGLVGREYLSQKVDREGKPLERPSYGFGNDGMPRIDRLVALFLGAKFKSEIEKATNSAITTVQAEMKKAHEAMLAEQKARFRDALAKVAS